MNNTAGCITLDPTWVMAIATVALAVITFFYLRATNALVNENEKMRKTQRELQERQLKQDLYVKRIGVFYSIADFLRDFQGPGRMGLGRIDQLVWETREAEFLFPSNETDAITQIRSKSERWRNLSEQLNDRRVEGDAQVARRELEQVEEWLSEDAWKLVKDKLGPHLTLWDV